MQKYDYVILGAGVAGLAFGHKMSKAGKSVLLLEKENEVGGLSKTIKYKEYYLDFCAHRFHTNNKELLKEILELPGLKMHKHVKKSRIYMFNKYLNYPFKLESLLRAMPLEQSIIGGIDFIKAMVNKKLSNKEVKHESYKDWFVYHYGNGLYNVMCYPYTSKIWKTDPSQLSSAWANQRFKGEDLSKLILRSVKKLLTLDFSDYTLEEDRLALDGGEFYYPKKGIQELPNAFQRSIENNGGKIFTSCKITNINKTSKTVTYERDGQKTKVQYEHLISTVPLNVLYHLQNEKEEKVEKAMSDLKYMDIVFVYAFLKKDRVSNDHWLYFPDKDISFNRAVEFSNWSEEMQPAGHTSVCFDVTTLASSNNLFSKSDKELSDMVINDAIKTNYIKEEDLIDTHVFRLKYAYPFYDLKYRDKLDILVEHLEDENTHLLGRTGIFRYNNSDNSIEMAFELANKFLQNSKNKSIYNYTIKEVSY